MFAANVVRVMIASPSDVSEARDAVEKALHGWNSAHAQARSLVLLPWRWETGAVAVMGDHPQALINQQGVDDSDVVIALFGGRLGLPTPDAVSGTAEEIDRALAQGKPVHMFFSTAPLPRDVDPEQLAGLNKFKQLMEQKGILGEFGPPEELGVKVWQVVEHDVAILAPEGAPTLVAGRGGVDFLVQPGQERELSGHQKNGNPKYMTRRWIDVINRGTSDAEEVTFELFPEDIPVWLNGPERPVTIQAGGQRRVGFDLSMASPGTAQVKIRWQEGGESNERVFELY